MNKTVLKFLLILPIHAFAGLMIISAQTPERLSELKVSETSLTDLDLSRASILAESNLEPQITKSVSDLSGLSPNLYINSNGIQSYGDVISVRGIGNTQLFGDPAVGLYIDGVPYGSTATFSSALFELYSVELFKGYRGHRFGKNSPGGVLNIKSQSAGKNHRSKLFVSYASFNTQSYRLLVDGPAGDDASYYFGLNRSKSDGFADNTNPLGNDATSESLNGRIGYDFRTAGGLRIGIGGTWEDFDLGAQPVVQRNANSGFYKRSSDQNEVGAIRSNTQFLKFESETEFGGISSTTSRTYWELDPNFLDLNYADSGLALVSGFLESVGNPIDSSSMIKEEHDGWSEELTAFSDNDGSRNWTITIFANNTEIDGVADRHYPVPTVAQNDPTYFNAGVMLPGSSITRYKSKNDSYALSTYLSQSLNNNITLEVGLRFDHITKELRRSKTNSLPFMVDPADLSVSEKYSWISPSIGFKKALNENFTTFLNSSLARKPGGFSPYVDTQALIAAGVVNIQYKDEKIWANELGLSFNNTQNKSGLSLVFFWNDITDFQFEKPSGAFDYFVDNAEEVEIHGLEFEFYANPQDDWLIQGSYGITSGEIKRHTGLSYDPSYDPLGAPANPILGPHDFAGKDVPFTPEQTLSLSLSNQMTEDLVWSSGLTYIGKIHYLDQTATDTVNNSYLLWNASITYLINQWELNLFGKNLTNKKYYSSLVTSLTGAPGIVGSPRVIGLGISKEF